MTAFGYVISPSLLALVLVWIAGIAAALTRKVMACVTWVSTRASRRNSRSASVLGVCTSSLGQACPINRKKQKKWLLSQAITNGRPVGSRTVFSQSFLKDLASV